MPTKTELEAEVAALRAELATQDSNGVPEDMGEAIVSHGCSWGTIAFHQSARGSFVVTVRDGKRKVTPVSGAEQAYQVMAEERG
jgi:hypothetical protein